MKKLLVGLLGLVIFLSVYPCMAVTDNVENKIGLFLCEYLDGEKTGNYFHFELTIGHSDNETTWFVSQEYIAPDDYRKCTFVALAQSDEKWKYDLPLLENVQWEPGKSVKCKYRAFGGLWVDLVIKKIPRTQNEWTAYGKGLYHTVDNGEKRKWELKSVKNVVLKYPKLELESQYK